jgi:hypothetical protein
MGVRGSSESERRGGRRDGLTGARWQAPLHLESHVEFKKRVRLDFGVILTGGTIFYSIIESAMSLV